MLTDKEFRLYSDGLFKSYFEKFILFKRSKGEKVTHSALSGMKYLNDTLNNYGTLEVTREMADEILAPKSDVSKFTRYSRVTYLRQFLDFLSLLGIECCRLPLKYARPLHCQFRPYIFSDDEILRLTNAADNMRKWPHHERRTEIYPILIRLLIGTGLRISEALALKTADIDSEDGVIKVMNSKNGVCRYVPASDSVKTVLNNYLTTIEDENILFKSNKTGLAYSYITIRAMFHKLCIRAKIFRPDGRTPNIHSLRHTFCSKSLEKLFASGMDLYVAMPILAAYVGHINFRDTESYIHFTENGYKEFLEKEAPLGKLIPGVKYVSG